jgi:hypothetical protein
MIPFLISSLVVPGSSPIGPYWSPLDSPVLLVAAFLHDFLE